MQSGLKNAVRMRQSVLETDFTEDLKKIDVPTLLLHGEDDQIVPVNQSSRKTEHASSKSVREIYYPGAPARTDGHPSRTR